MKILYYSDRYTYDNFGTKRSIFEEMKCRGFDIEWVDRSKIASAAERVRSTGAQQVWLAHSGLTVPSDLKAAINQDGALIVGFGMSDPNYFSPKRLTNYDAYITNSATIFDQYRNQLPCFYHRTACDFRFHSMVEVPRGIPISMVGLATHPFFPVKNERVIVVNELRKRGAIVHAYGNGWPSHPHNHGHVEGRPFLNLMQRTVLGLDIQNEHAPLAHRMFEYAGCGTPVITRRRDEVLACFEEDREILLYTSREELIEKVIESVRRPDDMRTIGRRAFNRCKNEHDITHRVDQLVPFIRSLHGDHI